jgi:hypothetical protein
MEPSKHLSGRRYTIHTGDSLFMHSSARMMIFFHCSKEHFVVAADQ